jgi:hypothetical protein
MASMAVVSEALLRDAYFDRYLLRKRELLILSWLSEYGNI